MYVTKIVNEFEFDGGSFIVEARRLTRTEYLGLACFFEEQEDGSMGVPASRTTEFNDALMSVLPAVIQRLYSKPSTPNGFDGYSIDGVRVNIENTPEHLNIILETVYFRELVEQIVSWIVLESSGPAADTSDAGKKSEGTYSG